MLLSGDPEELGAFCDELDRVCLQRFEGFETLEPPPEQEEEPPKPAEPESPPPEPEPRSELTAAPEPRAKGRPAPSPYDYRSVPLTTAPSGTAVVAFLLAVAGLLPRYGVPFAIAAAGLAFYNRFRAANRDPDWDPSLEMLTFILAFLGLVSFAVYGVALRHPESILSIPGSANVFSGNEIAGALVGIVVLLLSVSFHEAAHGLVSYWNGDTTAARLGRITLNPLPHIDLFGSIILPALLYFTAGAYFAYAKPVPVNPNRYRKLRAGLLGVSFAGPGSNFLLAIVGIWMRFLLMSILMILHHSTGSAVIFHPAVGRVVFYVLDMLVLVNIFLGCFNLIPVPPLDGYHLLEGLLPFRWTNWIRPFEGYGFIILFVLLLSGGFAGVFVYVTKFTEFVLNLLLLNPFQG